MRVSALDIKELIVDVLELEDICPEEIRDDEELFGGALPLDSIDALELRLAIRDRFQVLIDANDADLDRYFSSVSGLVELVNGWTP